MDTIDDGAGAEGSDIGKNGQERGGAICLFKCQRDFMQRELQCLCGRSHSEHFADCFPAAWSL